MTDDAVRREQAAGWLARLRSRSVTTDELAEFARWRHDPANAAAYQAAEALWETSGTLGGPEIDHALDAARRRRPLARWLHRPMARRISLGAGVAAVAIAVLAMPAPTRTFTTVVGERSFAQLDDDTKVQLDTDTMLTARYRPTERRVELSHGQAYFDVKHDPSRPFIVTAEMATVTALGTRFDVAADKDTLTVSLLEGRVDVASRASRRSVILAPGDSVRVVDGTIGPVLKERASDLTSWREGRLTFRNTPLGEALRAINRYTDRPLALASPSHAAEPISGDFAVDDIDGFAAAVRAMFGPDAVTRERTAR